MGMDFAGKTARADTLQAKPRSTLSFWQRHFQKPVDSSSNEEYLPQKRQFSLLSRGFFLSAGVASLAIIAILCAVLATELNHKKKPDNPFGVPHSNGSPVQLAILENFPDPAIMLHNGTWYAFGTNNAAGILFQPRNHTYVDYGVSNLQLATSPDFEKWTLLDASHDPLPAVGSWALQGLNNTTQTPRANVWAPAILKRPSDGNFVLYYAAADANHPRHHCVGAAISETGEPFGPYTPLNTTIACDIDIGGAIDPTTFIDVDGSVYLSWKVDGNSVGHGGICGNGKSPQVDTPIMLQKMMADGVTPDGNATAILHRTKADGPLVEAPAIVRSHEGKYFLFFSSGCTRTPSYNLKYAVADNVTGPYVRAKAPLLESGTLGLRAPGSASIGENADGGFMMAFHARVNTSYGGVRAMYTADIQFNNTEVTMLRSMLNSTKVTSATS